MKKVLTIVFLCIILNVLPLKAEVISGQINHDDINYSNKVVDSKTQQALSNAKITIPELHYTTYSDKNGQIQLNADVTDKTVLFVEKEGYKVFSLTIDNSVLNSPLKLGIEQSSPFDMQISQGVIHLGDNMFSDTSANSGEFRLSANGHFFSKRFKRPKSAQNQDVVIRIGTVIGLDTKKAKERGQNRIARVYSSPAEVIVNGHKIGTLELNGDNIEIFVPRSILTDDNELVIKTGRNLFQKNYTDYDDIELANIRVEVKDKSYYAGN